MTLFKIKYFSIHCFNNYRNQTCPDLEVSYLIGCDEMSSVQNRDGTRRREQVSDFSCLKAPTETSTTARTELPTVAPTETSTETPTKAPTETPTEDQTEAPNEALTEIPTEALTTEIPETTQPPCYGTETESCAMLFQCVHSYYMRVYDVLSDACPECYRRAFMNSGKLAKFKERLAGLATKFDDRPRCYEGCTTDTVEYLQNLHDTFVEESAASKFPFNHLNPLDFMFER